MHLAGQPNCFRAVVWSSDAGLLKPDRAVYDLAVRKTSAAPEQTLFVDDLEENVAGAKAARLAGWLHRDWKETRTVIEDWLRS
jgi:HAD superfamily hydrolase (TIGR01509 family)